MGKFRSKNMADNFNTDKQRSDVHYVRRIRGTSLGRSEDASAIWQTPVVLALLHGKKRLANKDCGMSGTALSIKRTVQNM